MARGSWLVARGSGNVARGSWFVVRGSWLVARGSGVVIRGSWLVTPNIGDYRIITEFDSFTRPTS